MVPYNQKDKNAQNKKTVKVANIDHLACMYYGLISIKILKKHAKIPKETQLVDETDDINFEFISPNSKSVRYTRTKNDEKIDDNNTSKSFGHKKTTEMKKESKLISPSIKLPPILISNRKVHGYSDGYQKRATENDTHKKKPHYQLPIIPRPIHKKKEIFSNQVSEERKKILDNVYQNRMKNYFFGPYHGEDLNRKIDPVELNLAQKNESNQIGVDYSENWLLKPVKRTKADINFDNFFEGRPHSAPPMSGGYYDHLFNK
ncbi:hypothetical protein ROZALSC1DRAFT_28531 [Rozella allomycis CSF55]|uniref:Uncharacterized protein n=1 Tax=Rozella allomycis (strain CSF55) TaxID=988480 RepID=A0A075AYE1_ROZAC|nr:hypothetical protein O9G_000693 [Rozella allomycis CSF55]RKP19925.1 hypothetical protein ROZALSC1DRAFT_28531 [Rozella allomycis CSF55]|eukprot:EPZ35297.1 hypothetical protein O9G_000693 [Rozella allomycis CSF55]